MPRTKSDQSSRAPPLGIGGREYKLLLDQYAFTGPPQRVAKQFWERRLKPLIGRTFDDEDGEGRAHGELELKKRRIVTFHDSKKRFLNDQKFALRKRTKVEDGRMADETELTLKFRSPDIMLAAEYLSAASKCPGETILEDDIGPLQVVLSKKMVAVAHPPTTSSRFAVSTDVTDERSLESLGDVYEQFEMLKEALGRQTGGDVSSVMKLVPGPTIFEWVFQKATVDLGEITAEFGFTLWYFSTGKPKDGLWKKIESGEVAPRVAEISFDFKTEGGRMSARAAQRASALFIKMQKRLRANPRETGKTVLALP